ncbi:MAG: glycosyltransferase family 2 protein, partial [Patescibacteria group bacterium]
MARFSQSISVFFPAYNEAENIRDLVLKTYDYLKVRFDDFEIMVVNDGSSDDTAWVVEGLQQEKPRLKLISHPTNCGYAQALRTGFMNVSKELIFYTDGDGQFDINELDLLLPLIERYDIVTGYKIKRHDPLMRLWMSWFYNTTMRLIFGLRLKDINCAFKLYRRRVIEAMDFLPDLTQGVVNAEVYVTALRQGYTIGEVGVHHYPRLKGTAAGEFGRRGKIIAWVRPTIIFKFVKDTIKLWRKFNL